MRQRGTQDGENREQQNCGARPVVGAQAGCRIGTYNQLSFSNWPRTNADGYGVYMRGEHPDRSTDGTRQLHHHVSNLPADWRTPVGVVERERAFRNTGLEQLAADE